MLGHFDIPKLLKTSLKNGGDFADIFYEYVQPTSIVCEDGKIEKITSGIDVGVGLRIIYQNKTAYAYTNQITDEGLFELADAVSCACQGKVFERDISLMVKSPEIKHSIKRLPQEVNIDDKVALVKRADDVARSRDERIKQVKVVYVDSVRRIAVANTVGELVEDHRTGIMFTVQVVATHNDVIQTGYEPIGGFIGFELFEEHPPEKVAEIASTRAIKMLQARRPPGGIMPVVLSSEAGGTMIHEAIGHGLEADLAQMGLSVYTGRIGDEVASPLVNVVDDATLAHKRGSYAFDDEGVRAQRTILVEQGVLKGYLYDRLTAMKDHTLSTGNGRRESYQCRPLPRMSNTFILPGKMCPKEIVRSTSRGLFVKKMGGGQVNTINGDFVFEVSEGYLIENGKIGEAVRGVTLTGNGPALLEKIDMVGNDFGFGIGTCGKDGQGVPVSDAQPTLRIPEIIVGGEV
ncbi:MAG: peptidase C69 [Deltaproteobacteria bacterium DG_8]|nr:MAG: peptidase C69 [Deltaproteobacteria bacterium DG_8]